MKREKISSITFTFICLVLFFQVSIIVGKKTLYLYNLNDPDNPIELAFQVNDRKKSK